MSNVDIGPFPGGREASALRVVDLVAGYGVNVIVDGVSLNVERGEVVCILGGNGSGKSTLVKTIAGELPAIDGLVEICGVPSVRQRDQRRAQRLVGYVPQLESVFAALTVFENLQIGAYRLARRDRLRRCEEVLELFPALRGHRRKRAELLSGGERRLLGVARALIADPPLLILDEPTANLSPVNARQVLDQCVRAAAIGKTGVLLVEQRIREALSVASRAYVLAGGKVAMSGDANHVATQAEFTELVVGRKRRTSVLDRARVHR